MTIVGIFRPFPRCYHQAVDRFLLMFPCLADPARRSSLGLKVALVMLHLMYAGVLFWFDGNLIERTKTQPWYTGSYLFLFVATLLQYFTTSGSSPGYVLDAMRAVNETNIGFQKTSMMPNSKDDILQNKNGSLIVTLNHATSWTKMVMDLYPPGASCRSLICSFCNAEQPPRAKHCHDCDKCVLQFDHHCVWLGTCVGQGNHCRFWWYVCDETVLCVWTFALYILYLEENMTKAWWKDGIVSLLLIMLSICSIFLVLLLLFHSYLLLTNQTTYELVRRKRIPYLRGIPQRVYPFSRGMCRNIYSFCCAPSSIHRLEPLPSFQMLDEMSRPYTCLDTLTCRCC